jgi:hypothetical protein
VRRAFSLYTLFISSHVEVHAPIMSARRVAMADDVLPLGTPYTDRKGVQHESLPCEASFHFIYYSTDNR